MCTLQSSEGGGQGWKIPELLFRLFRVSTFLHDPINLSGTWDNIALCWSGLEQGQKLGGKWVELCPHYSGELGFAALTLTPQTKPT